MINKKEQIEKIERQLEKDLIPEKFKPALLDKLKELKNKQDNIMEEKDTDKSVEDVITDATNVAIEQYNKEPNAKNRTTLINLLGEFFVNIVIEDWSKFTKYLEFNNKINRKAGKTDISFYYNDMEEDIFKNLNQNLWELIPENQKTINSIKKIKYKPEVNDKGLAKLTKDFVASDEFRPVMTSVHFEKKEGEIATDAHKLLWLSNDTKANGNYCLHKHCKSTKVDVKDIKYPYYQGIIPDITTGYEISNIEVDSLRRYLKGIIAMVGDYGYKSTFLQNTYNTYAYNTEHMLSSIEIMVKLGYKKVSVCLAKDDTRNKAMIICPIGKESDVNSFDTDFVLLMPTRNEPKAKQLVFSLDSQTVYAYDTEFKEYPLSTVVLKELSQKEDLNEVKEIARKALEQTEQLTQKLEQEKIKAKQEAEAKAEQDRLNKIIEARKNKISEMNKRIDLIEKGKDKKYVIESKGWNYVKDSINKKKTDIKQLKDKIKQQDDLPFAKGGNTPKPTSKTKKFEGEIFTLHKDNVTKAGIIKLKRKLLKENPNTYFRTFKNKLYIRIEK